MTSTTTLLLTCFDVAIPFLLHETTKMNANCFDVIFLCSCCCQVQQIATGLKHCSITLEVVHTLLLICNVEGLHLTEQQTFYFHGRKTYLSRSRWPCGLMCKSAASWLLISWVWIPLRAWMFVSCALVFYVSCGLCVSLRSRSLTQWERLRP